VRANNAHTWVEVFFPRFGWIQFEPTASIPLVERPAGDDASGGGDGFDDPLPNEETGPEEMTEEELAALTGDEPLGFDPEGEGSSFELEETREFPAWGYQALIGLAILVLAYLGFVAANRANRQVEADLERSYQRLNSWSGWLGLNPRPSQTPYERADSLAGAVPEGQRSIFNLTHHYVLRKFSRRQDDPFFSTLQEWRTLRPLLVRQTVARRVDMLRDRLRGLLRRR
jgi:hypothetical protein